ncbi:MAG: hypothetical protein IJW63_12125, partial [Lachnospiraceae bacterium]|nr:hypothetical protein [Lachnospiraceae bacterium]
ARKSFHLLSFSIESIILIYLCSHCKIPEQIKLKQRTIDLHYNERLKPTDMLDEFDNVLVESPLLQRGNLL